MSLRDTLSRTFDSFNSEKIDKLLTYLNSKGVNRYEDLRYLTKNELEKYGILNDEEINKILKAQIPIKDAIKEILIHEKQHRIDYVTNIFENEGLVSADEIKYYDLGALSKLDKLSEMEVKKIMRYIEKKFPDEYREHKDKERERSKLKSEVIKTKMAEEHEEEKQKLNQLINMRNITLRNIDHIRERHSQFKTDELCLFRNNLKRKNYVLGFTIGVALLSICFVIFGIYYSVMGLALMICLVGVTILLGFCLIFEVYKYHSRRREAEGKLASIKISIIQEERQIDSLIRELDEIDRQLSSRFK